MIQLFPAGQASIRTKLLTRKLDIFKVGVENFCIGRSFRGQRPLNESIH